jgi:DNA mismatch endonuclease Vsr
MSDVHTPEQRHKNMAAIHSSSTKPELKLRRALWSLGFRYRINEKDLPGKPDIVLPKYRTVVFVHGCFWHGHKGCKYYTVPKTNTEFWTAKVTRNQQRDQEVWRQLEAKGWAVIIVWECELKKYRFEDTVNSVAAEIVRNGNTYQYIRAARKKARALYQEEQKTRKEREAALKAELRKG